MKNSDLIREYISGDKYQGKTGHLGYMGNALVNYSTVLCRLDRTNLRALVNPEKYSRSTGAIQSSLRALLTAAGYAIEEHPERFGGWHNAGYQGAANIDYNDIRRAAF